MLDVDLNLISKLLVIIISMLHFEIDEESQVIVEAQELVLGLSVAYQHLLEDVDFTSADNVPGTTIETVTVFGEELVDIHSVFRIIDNLRIIMASTVLADIFGLLDGNLNFLGQAQVDEGVHAALVLLQHLRLLDVSWEIGQDESIP